MTNKKKLTEVFGYSPNVEYTNDENCLVRHLIRKGKEACEETIEQIKALGYSEFKAFEDKSHVLISAPIPNSPIVFMKNTD